MVLTPYLLVVASLFDPRGQLGGFLDQIDQFDPAFFGLSKSEASYMDPQQRLLMTHAWAAIEDAGYAPGSLAGGDTAIFVGTAPSGYARRIEQAGVGIEVHSSTGSVASVGPNRMSYLLDLHGPSEPVETACSSALVAIHRAVEAIRHGRCQTALAGAVNTIVLPEVHISFDKAGMLSSDGRCKTFSRHADGYGRGEGVAMLLLKDLEAAERAMFVTPNGVQILGGHGFMQDYPVEKLMREARALGLMLGGVDVAREAAGAELAAVAGPVALTLERA